MTPWIYSTEVRVATEVGLIRVFSLFATLGIRGAPDGVERRAAVIAVWLDVTADVTDDQLEGAARLWLRTADAEWWPMPGKLLSYLPGHRVAALTDDADAALTRLSVLVQRLGRHAKPDAFDMDHAENLAIRAGLEALGGWAAFCEAPDPTPGWDRKTFRDAYRRTKERHGIELEEQKVIQLDTSRRRVIRQDPS